MTNIIDAMLVYTNVAFQLMLGDASRVSAALDLPIKTPIEPAAVSKWKIATLGRELEGTLDTAGYQFTFERGIFTKVVDTVNAGGFIPINDVSSVRRVWQWTEGKPRLANELPNTPEGEPYRKFLESGLAKLGLNVALLGAPNTKLPGMKPPRYLVIWRPTNAAPSVAEIFEDPRRLTGLELDTDVALRAGGKKLTIDVPAPEANLQLFTNMVRVPLGIGAASEGQTRQVVHDCFEALQKNLPSDPLQAIIVEDNVGQPEIVRATLSEILKNFPETKCAYFSIPWENPPPQFPQQLVIESSKHRRGLSMVAIIGNARVTFKHAPELTGPRNIPWTKESEKEAAEATPAVRELLRSLNISGPLIANALFPLPTSPAGPKDEALGKAAENIAMLSHSNNHIDRWTSSIGDDTRTNEIVLALISGNLGDQDWAKPPSLPPVGFPMTPPSRRPARQYPFQGLIHMFTFEENPRMETYRRIGDVGLRILKKADEIETFRLWLLSERMNKERKGELIDGHVIKSKGPILKPRVKETLQEMMFREPERENVASMCIYDPGIAFRMTTTEGSISALVCFDCADFSWTVRDPKGTTLASGGIRPDPVTMKRLRQIGLIAFPDFRELRRGNDE